MRKNNPPPSMTSGDTTQTEPSRQITSTSPEDGLKGLLKMWQIKRKRWPQMMPRDLDEAARWWVWMQEPADPRFEAMQLRPLQGKEETEMSMAFPYIERLRNTLTAFLGMNHTKQTRVVAARQEGFWWRGESEDVWWKNKDGKSERVWSFEVVLREYARQRMIGTVAYQKEAVERMKQMKVSQELPYDKDKWLSGRD